VLTAAHVAGNPKQAALVWMSDGSVKRGITLGLNQELDAGMIKITEPGEWPFAPLGKSSQLKAGQWCLATGHPGGFDGSRRSPVLRWGRVLKTERSAILTDCTLVGGDSGGPLFDMNGRVVGIHSRIGKNLTINVHVPVDPYRSAWNRLVRGEVWGMLDPTQQGWLGVTEDGTASDARILKVVDGSPARLAGLRAGDVVIQVGEAQIKTFGDLQSEIRQHRPEDEVRLLVRRGEKEVPMVLRLGKRPTRRRDR
jgi:serine protease Do